MKIAVIGAGGVGDALGTRLRDQDHSVRWGVRKPGDPKYAGMDARDILEAAADAEILILAVPWSAAEDAITQMGDVRGKIVIDAMNPITPDFSGLVNLGDKSAGEMVAGWALGARVVKAFNTIGSNIMEDPRFGDINTTILIAGDDEAAKNSVSQLAHDIGFTPVDAGPLAMSRHLEALAWIWITLAVKQGLGRDIVFQLLRR